MFASSLGRMTLLDGGGDKLQITAGAVSVVLEGVSYANAHAMGDVAWLAQMQVNGHLAIL